MLHRWTIDSFKEVVLGSDVPVLVDFFADWCGPCGHQLPIIQGLAEELSGKTLIGKVDVDESPELANLFRVSSIPTLLVFRNGQLVKRFVGVTSAKTLRSELLPEARTQGPAL